MTENLHVFSTWWEDESWNDKPGAAGYLDQMSFGFIWMAPCNWERWSHDFLEVEAEACEIRRCDLFVHSRQGGDFMWFQSLGVPKIGGGFCWIFGGWWNYHFILLRLVEEIRRLPVEVGSLSHYLQGFIHVRWCRISSINRSISFN